MQSAIDCLKAFMLEKFGSSDGMEFQTLTTLSVKMWTELNGCKIISRI